MLLNSLSLLISNLGIVYGFRLCYWQIISAKQPDSALYLMAKDVSYQFTSI